MARAVPAASRVSRAPRAFPIWADGRVRPPGSPAVSADDSAFREGRGAYTSALVRRGEVRLLDRHVARLQRSARALGFEAPGGSVLEQAFRELARAAFGLGDGVVRMQVSEDARGTRVTGLPRALGADRSHWRAITAPIVHPGPSPLPGHKLTHRLEFALAGEAASRASVDEALLLDRHGRFVEGSRSNLVVEDASGNWLTPPAERGAVAGLALEVLRESAPIRERDLGPADLRAARGVCLTNAVRGARALAELDARPLGAAGDRLASRIADVLDLG